MRQLCLVFLAVVLLSAMAQATPIQVLSPEGNLEYFLGGKMFQTYEMWVEQKGDNLEIKILTNNPGPFAGIEYDRADLFVWKGSQCILAVKMGGGELGKIYYDPNFNTSELFAGAGVPFGRYKNGEYIPVQAIGGQLAGVARVAWQKNEDGKYFISISLPLKVFAKIFASGWLKFEWATAFCGNSVAEGWFYLVLPNPPLFREVGMPCYPSIRVWKPVVPIPGSFWLFASGLVALLAWKRWK
jgi:hypothetical protein